MELKDLTRKNIWNLKPYSCARSEYKGDASIWLDANESPFNLPFNRYPDPLQLNVKRAISPIKNIPIENIFLGVGSDEGIDLLYRIFCEPGIDNVVAISPSYGMYEVCADINNVEYRKVPLTAEFDLDEEAMMAATDKNTKLMWICSPNNPTGTAYSLDRISNLCSKFSGILIIDEAYIDFSSVPSATTILKNHPNLVILQTFSKAWGSAAVRCGMAFASTKIIDLFNKVKYPYNINNLTQDYIIRRIGQLEQVLPAIEIIIALREEMKVALLSIPCVTHVYNSDANFILVKVTNANKIYNYLRELGIIVRNRHSVEKCANCLRITIGSRAENEAILKALINYEARSQQ